ncbi:MAG: bis(5'-nucleosyl)-tetraphosphatase (symmetrical) YqeK [Clostridiales Family XIII bacterium]|jgi:ribosome silencing factor RsfS/YbeB/iojap|nr:bis(5'-nucleosyl)-tetraphosphatase (symmetrical) YqeK [Clostridiales Family XIII bacterium]
MDYKEIVAFYGLDALWAEIGRTLKPERQAHTRGVMETAHRLALKYGADGRKAVIAAMFHDYFRGAGDEELDGLVGRYGLDARLKGRPSLSHGKIAAEHMRERHGFEDAELLDAVRFHTTGRAGMALLEKVIYLADCIEPSRDYEEAGLLRGLEETAGLDAALEAALLGSMAYVREKGEELDGDTVKAYEFLRNGGAALLTNKEIAMRAAETLCAKKGIDVTLIDVKDVSSYADFIVIASGSNERQVGSLADDVEDALGKIGALPRHIEGRAPSGWILMDYGDLLVNVFSRDQRATYNIEQLWSDCETITVEG